MKIFLVAVVIFVALIMYWVIVVSISTDYAEQGNEFGEKAFTYRAEGLRYESDSCWILFQHYIHKSDKAEMWLPMFLRPSPRILQIHRLSK